MSIKDPIYIKVQMIEVYLYYFKAVILNNFFNRKIKDLVGGSSHVIEENLKIHATTQSGFTFRLKNIAQLGLYQSIHGKQIIY